MSIFLLSLLLYANAADSSLPEEKNTHGSSDYSPTAKLLARRPLHQKEGKFPRYF